jgi:hypothetical protein
MVAGKERAEDANQRFLGISDYDSGSRPRAGRGQLLRDEHGAGPRVPEIIEVAARHGQRQCVGAGQVERSHRRDAYLSIAKQAATDEVGDRLRGETARCHATSCLI